MESRTKIIIGALVASFCGCCCFSGMLPNSQSADRQAIATARAACVVPSTFRLRRGGLSTRPADWECLTAEQIHAEDLATAIEAARVTAAAEAAAAEQRAQIRTARMACVAPNVFRASRGSDESLASSWACVTPETIASEQAAAHVAEVAAAERADREAAAAEAARIAALPLQVRACEVERAYEANELAADRRFPEGGE